VTNIHATAIAFGAHGVLLRGTAGCGKSSLALQLIDGEGSGGGPLPMRASLVADDQTMLALRDKLLWLSAPALLANALELRGWGIIKLPVLASAQLTLVVDLLPLEKIERLPHGHDLHAEILGLTFPRLMLPIGASANPARVRAVLNGLIAQSPAKA
jgi:HPr kinase/phosphorylase